MSHEIREWDKQQGRTQAWHGLTEINPELSLDGAHYLKTWDVETVGIRAVTKKGQLMAMKDAEGNPLKLESLCVMKTEGDFLTEPLFVSTPYNSGTYSPLTNANFLSIIAKSLGDAGLKMDVESMGSVFNRRRTFVSIPLAGLETMEAGGREFKNFLNFINSFDQSTPFMANVSGICTVCNNTLSANLSTGGCLIKHTQNMPERLANIPQVITEALTVQREFANDFLQLHSATIEKQNMHSLFVAFVASGTTLSTRAHNIAEKLVELFVNGKGNAGKTLADGFSAITEYYTHFSAGKSEDKSKQFVSSEFGDGAKSKRQGLSYLLEVLHNEDKRGEEIAKGEKLLTDYRKAE